MTEIRKPDEQHPLAFSYPDLACERYGGKVLMASDDFFAEKENLIKNAAPIFITDKYTDRGKWMDGWESRRKRTEGYDWCIVKLGLPGKIKGVDVDTSFFTGNHPPQISIEAINLTQNLKDAQVATEFSDHSPREILIKSNVRPDAHNFFKLENQDRATHLRLNIFPDGGVARLRVYGEVDVDFAAVKKSELIEVSNVLWGGRPLSCSDKFYSHPNNLLMPGKGINMGDGWETKRRRGPGHDWVIIKLGRRSRIEKILVDTLFFKGNYPDNCSLDAVDWAGEDDGETLQAIDNWQAMMGKQTVMN